MSLSSDVLLMAELLVRKLAEAKIAHQPNVTLTFEEAALLAEVHIRMSEWVDNDPE